MLDHLINESFIENKYYIGLFTEDEEISSNEYKRQIIHFKKKNKYTISNKNTIRFKIGIGSEIKKCGIFLHNKDLMYMVPMDRNTLVFPGDELIIDIDNINITMN